LLCDTSGVTGKVMIGLLLCATAFAAPPQSGLDFGKDGTLHLPRDYRSWVYLTSGFDMSYQPAMQMGDEHLFDNVFVNPEAYRVFQATGTWPDKTMLVLEERHARAKGSINQTGNFQGSVAGVEVHVKDEARFPGSWAFFSFDGDKPATMIPATASCYSCHEEHGAVDTTFVQFYPTLLPIATEKHTLAPSFAKEH
jgi:hypothetical protein